MDNSGKPPPPRGYPDAHRGFTVFFTGLPAAGKSTTAEALTARLGEIDDRAVTLLDGDIVRKLLSSELGFSRAHRDLNILRIGFVAAEVTKHRGIAVCSAIAPYREARLKVREMVAAHGGFFEVYVSTPLEVCEMRDPKGLYARARAGRLPGFTGIDDPYEVPERPELSIDTSACTPDDAVRGIIDRLVVERYLADQHLPRGGSQA